MRRELLIVLGLFVLLALFVAFGPAQADNSPGQSGVSHSSGTQGALALYSWLDDLGYAVERLEYQAFELDEAGELLFLLAPSEPVSAAEADAILAWVEAGGTLVLAESRPGGGAANTLLRRLDMRLEEPGAGWLGDVPVIQPALGQPPLSRIRANTTTRIVPGSDDVAVLAAVGSDAVLVGQQRGAGYVYLSSTLAPFSNAGLRDADNAAVVLNLLRRVQPGARVLFDEIHHGFVSEPSLRGLLLSNPWGWAAIYAMLVGVAYVAASGRRFGRPVPLREETVRRSSAEYLESMAGLLRRGRKQAFIGQHYRAALKRRLARPLGLSPSLDDATFAAEVAALRSIDAAALGGLLVRLGRPDLSEAELLRLVAEADRMLER